MIVTILVMMGTGDGKSSGAALAAPEALQ